MTTNGTLSRSFTYDNIGDTKTDAKGGATATSTYNNAGELASLTVGASGRGPYVYDAFGLMASRTVTTDVPARRQTLQKRATQGASG